MSEGGHWGRISRLELDGQQSVIVDNLPGPGNNHTNMLTFGPDGKLYSSQGAMTNIGVIGLDAYVLGWLRPLSHAHDLPGYDMTLTGVDFVTEDPLSDEPAALARPGGFVSFATEAGQPLAAQNCRARRR